jgi:hypothetical protein
VVLGILISRELGEGDPIFLGEIGQHPPDGSNQMALEAAEPVTRRFSLRASCASERKRRAPATFRDQLRGGELSAPRQLNQRWGVGVNALADLGMQLMLALGDLADSPQKLACDPNLDRLLTAGEALS